MHTLFKDARTHITSDTRDERNEYQCTTSAASSRGWRRKKYCPHRWKIRLLQHGPLFSWPATPPASLSCHRLPCTNGRVLLNETWDSRPNETMSPGQPFLWFVREIGTVVYLCKTRELKSVQSFVIWYLYTCVYVRIIQYHATA